MFKTLRSTVTAVLGLLAAISPASSQTMQPWSPIAFSEFGRGTLACAQRHSEGEVLCFGLRCSATGGSEWFTHQVGGNSVEGEALVNLVIDSANHFTLPMKQAATSADGWAFSVAYDPARDDHVVAQLKSGSSLYVLIGGLSASPLTLRGSSREIDRVLAMCAAPAAAQDGPEQVSGAPGGSFDTPDEAVHAMAARQGCRATESEIFETITGAGFGVWDANQYIVGGSQSGALHLLDKTNHLYRVAGCTAASDPLAVDPDATELAMTAQQLPQAVRAALREIAESCGDAFLTDTSNENALLAEDIDGDGTYDFLLEHVEFCPEQRLFVCGASKCPVTLVVSQGGAWRRFDYIMLGYSEFSEAGFLFMCSTDERKAGVFMENGKLTERTCNQS